MWPYVCVYSYSTTFNCIWFVRLLCLSAMTISWMHWNRTMSRHWKVTKSRTRSRCLKRKESMSLSSLPGFDGFILILLVIVVNGFYLLWFYLFYTYFAILLFCYSEIQSSECLSLVLFRLNVTRVWLQCAAQGDRKALFTWATATEAEEPITAITHWESSYSSEAFYCDILGPTAGISPWECQSPKPLRDYFRICSFPSLLLDRHFSALPESLLLDG